MSVVYLCCVVDGVFTREGGHKGSHHHSGGGYYSEGGHKGSHHYSGGGHYSEGGYKGCHHHSGGKMEVFSLWGLRKKGEG